MLILGLISEGIVSAGIWMASGIYHVAAFVFELFLILASGQLLEADAYETIITNFYIILGIIMLFILAFSLLKGMVNPDDQKQGTSAVKKVIVNIITSSIIMAVLPTIFAFAYDFQDSVINSQNSIGKFFGYGGTGESPSSQSNIERVKGGAYQIVNGVFTAFFDVSEEHCKELVTDSGQNYDSKKAEITYCRDNTLSEEDDSYTVVVNHVDRTGAFGSYSDFAENADKNEIDFNFLLSLIAGALLIYVGVSFCFDMAIRLVKLVFFQLIAPIPIFFRIIPDGKLSGVFGTWMKKTVSCYLEVYVRIFVFYFVIYLCGQMIEGTFLKEEIYEYGWFIGGLARAFVLMGLITFMRQAPKLLGEITGIDSGNMSLGIKDKLAAGGAFTAGAILGGGATALTRNAVNKWGNKENWKNKSGKVSAGSVMKNLGSGVLSAGIGGLSGAVRSGKAGWNAKSAGDMKSSAAGGAAKAVSARDKRANYKAAHGGFIGAMGGHVKDFGSSVKNYFFDESMEGLTRESQSMGNLYSKYNTFNDTIENLLEKEQSKGNGSVFLGNGFALAKYAAFDLAAQDLATARTQFNNGAITSAQLRVVEGAYIAARDSARDELMDMALQGSKGAGYTALTAKGQAALKDSLVNAESLQATILENANTRTVQEIMGPNGNGALKDIMNNVPLTNASFSYNGSKLKDAAKVAQGKADIKIAEMNKEQAAKGDKK